MPGHEAVGLYYDEANQAPAAFAYVGKTPEMFSVLSVGGAPLMNFSYVGALKSAVYGAYMRVTRQPFSVRSWRLTALLSVALGLVAFAAAAGGSLSPPALGLFFALLLSDLNVLLLTRHDYGPAALSLLLRLLFLAVWMLPPREAAAIRRRAALMGALLGLAVFEKASAAALLPALAAYLWASRSDRKGWAAAAAGLAAGCLPLLAANAASLAAGQGLITLQAVDRPGPGGVFPFLKDYLGLGQGWHAAGWILDLRLADPLVVAEGLALALILVLALLESRRGSSPEEDRSVQGLVFSYLAAGAVLRLLPYRTELHHHILGTPFQYLAIALWAGSLLKRRSRLLPMLALLVLLLRLPGLAAARKAVRSGQTGVMWDRSFTDLAEFAARRADESVFVAADWGFAAQIYCLAQGREGLAFEPFWDYRGPQSLQPALSAAGGKKALYVLTRRFRPPLRPESTEAILRDVARLEGWVRAGPEPGLESRAIQVLKYLPRSRPRP